MFDQTGSCAGIDLEGKFYRQLHLAPTPQYLAVIAKGSGVFDAGAQAKSIEVDGIGYVENVGAEIRFIRSPRKKRFCNARSVLKLLVPVNCVAVAAITRCGEAEMGQCFVRIHAPRLRTFMNMKHAGDGEALTEDHSRRRRELRSSGRRARHSPLILV